MCAAATIQCNHSLKDAMNDKLMKNVSYSDLEKEATTGGGKWVAGAFELIKSVKVGITAVAGSAELTVHRLMELKNGDVLKLDRTVDGPVDLVLEGKVIARGELVVVGDNFGIRLTEVGANEVS